MKFTLLFFATLLLSAGLLAQDKMTYAEKAAQLQKEIWGNPIPEFKATTVPAGMEKESAVVLARTYNSLRTSNGKLKFLIITAAVATRTVKLNTLHERVKINDKTALESFSKLEYKKILDKTVSLLVASFKNQHNTYIGAKIIKPNGKEIIVNTSEEVLTKNETKDKDGKLAIPDLAVGDILDYYITTDEITENADGNSYRDNDDLFVLADEYPVLYYGIDFQFNKKVSVKYIYANNAPHFEESHNDAGDLLLSLKLRNLPKYQSTLWTSRLRQYPYIEIGSSYANAYNSFLAGEKKIGKANTMLEMNKMMFETAFEEYPDFNAIEKKTKDYFVTSKAYKNAPLDTVMKVLYDEWKYATFCTYFGDELDKVNDLNYRTPNSKFFARTMSLVLTDMEINHDVLMVSSRNSNSLDNVYGMSDFSAAIRINGDKPMYMFFDDVVTHFNEIPARFQGEKVIVMHPKRHNSRKYTFTYDDAVLPITSNDKNQTEEQIQVSMVASNMQQLKISRFVSQSGSLRHDYQKSLIPVQFIDAGLTELVNGEPLDKRLKQMRETKKMSKDYLFSFDKEKGDLVKNFTAEIKGNFDQEPQQVADVYIHNKALENTNPVFKYSATFTLDNLVKKAGENYIIDAGKLTGTFLTLDKKDETRDIDIYMPSARSFNYTISIAIPDGFVAKGVEELSIKKENKTGAFTSEAVLKGNNLIITVKRVYYHNFEKAADWPLLKELIETASAFNDQKVLLEKKG